ncbi:helix-turn-helix domain-containing protein [Nocardioides renjunii]|uniref:helix-turn-helix domain-containing protein n=1 Tax=Nocardioides renjunii TaxID=3095075 RepID=UPI002AFDE51B|nr:helix-turn-helix transcriptional regulator [Nocardioides sp. S-34]WQQ21121.1 helix-turn-helix transcriptional regulator [Nocardioides sp. S-34]
MGGTTTATAAAAVAAAGVGEPAGWWGEAEWQWYDLGPFEGGIPGMVRRVRRILDVSQRGLAGLLEVSQSVVARWETGRTSPRASVLHAMVRRAGLRERYVAVDSGEEVEPMRDDGARRHGGSRFPAHVDLRVNGWWAPAGLRSSMELWNWVDRSRVRRDPMVRCRTSRWLRRLERLMWGTPDDHPSLRQLAAEAEHRDERRDELLEQRRRHPAA